MAGRLYSNEFKIQAVKSVVEDGVSSAQVARELGININTLREWVKRYKENQNEPYVDELFKEIHKIAPCGNDNRRELLLFAERGKIED